MDCAGNRSKLQQLDIGIGASKFIVHGQRATPNFRKLSPSDTSIVKSMELVICTAPGKTSHYVKEMEQVRNGFALSWFGHLKRTYVI